MKSEFTEDRYVLNSHEFELARTAHIESMLGDNHWSRQEGAESPFVALNKDPVRAKYIGEINRKREKERANKGEHQWQDPEVIARLVQQRIESGVLVENGKKTRGKLWWNNGMRQTRAFECPGEGWVRGRLPYPPNTNRSPEATENRRKAQLGKKLTEEHKQAISKGMLKFRGNV
jgi:hypothetical protein